MEIYPRRLATKTDSVYFFSSTLMFDELPLSHWWEVEIKTLPASYDFISNEETEGRKRPSLWLPLLSPTVGCMRVGSTFTPLAAGDNWILMWVRNMKSLLRCRRPWRTLAIKHNHGTTELLVHRHGQRGEAAESIFQFRGWNSGLKFTTLTVTII